jgi:hypothetical protein
MQMLALNFLIVGEVDDVFTVEIDIEESVGILIDEIKKKKKKELSPKYDADKLTIYLAKKDGNWLQYDDADVSQLKKKDVPFGIQNKYCTSELKMEPTFQLKKYFSGIRNIPKDKEYHGLVVVPASRKEPIVVPAYISQPSQASFMTVSGSFWNSSPINHRIALDALTMMEREEVESTCFDLCAKEILKTLSKANRHEDLAGIFYNQSIPHGEISLTALLIEIIARTLDSYHHMLRWYHQLQDPADGVVDVALYAVRKKGFAQGLQIPCAIIETGLNQSPDSKRWQTIAYLINQSHLLDDASQALLSVELILNFNHRHSLSLRCSTLTGQRALWNSTIWTGEATETALARVLYVLVENAKRNAEADQIDWKMLGPNCALDLKTSKVYKCFDYRYQDPAYKRSAIYYIDYLSAQPVVEFNNLLVITYDYVRGSHVAENTFDFIPILKMLGLLHDKHLVHGDIRLSNIVFAGIQSSLIDFDFSGEHGAKKYPAGFNREIFDGFRHPGAKENAVMKLEHDLFALARLMNLFSTTESSEKWFAVCSAVSIGDIKGAIQLLEKLQIPLRFANHGQI